MHTVKAEIYWAALQESGDVTDDAGEMLQVSVSEDVTIAE